MKIMDIIIKRIEGTGTQTHILKCGSRYLSPVLITKVLEKSDI